MTDRSAEQLDALFQPIAQGYLRRTVELLVKLHGTEWTKAQLEETAAALDGEFPPGWENGQP